MKFLMNINRILIILGVVGLLVLFGFSYNVSVGEGSTLLPNNVYEQVRMSIGLSQFLVVATAVLVLFSSLQYIKFRMPLLITLKIFNMIAAVAVLVLLRDTIGTNHLAFSIVGHMMYMITFVVIGLTLIDNLLLIIGYGKFVDRRNSKLKVTNV
jgi:hypothetical protein